MVDAASLLGSWQLVSIQVRNEDTGEVADLHGPNPQGCIVFTPERMAVLITSSGRKPPAGEAETAALFQGLSAYTGRYRLEGTRLITDVDVAWHPAWVNTEQPRHYMLDGDRLTLTTDVQDHPARPGQKLRGSVVWTREA